MLDDKTGCSKKAEWRAWFDTEDPYLFTDGCSEHIIESIDDKVMSCTLERI
jgi:hypothetical protein